MSSNQFKKENPTSIILLILLLLPLLSTAQISFEQVLPPPPAPQIIADFEGLNYSAVSFADIDNDADEDLLITGFNGEKTSKIYKNDGIGNFSLDTTATIEPVSDGTVSFEDIDNDGDLDLLITGSNNDNLSIAKIYLNDGLGNFSEKQNIGLDAVYSSAVAFEDVDLDNDLDLLITGWTANNQSISKLYSNDGLGNFSEIQGLPFQAVRNGSVAFSDVDGDGDFDLLIAGLSDITRITKLYINNGHGVFAESISANFTGVQNGSVSFADLDGDLDQDLIIIGLDNNFTPITQLYINNGHGVFSVTTNFNLPGATDSSILLVDIDSDGDIDVLFNGDHDQSSRNYISKLFLNNGSATFTEIPNSPFEGVKRGSISASDINQDGTLDILITGVSPFGSISKLYINNENLSFSELSKSMFEGIEDGQVAIIDINGDSDKDFLIYGETRYFAERLQLFINFDGSFVENTNVLFDPLLHGSFAFGDFDGDLDVDLFLTGFNDQ